MSIYDNDIVNIKDIEFSDRPIKVQFDPQVIKKLKKLLKRCGKMGQMEYSDFIWQDAIQEIIDEAEK